MDTIDNFKDARLELPSLATKLSSKSIRDEVSISGSPGQILYREYLTGWRLHVLTLWYVSIRKPAIYTYQLADYVKQYLPFDILVKSRRVNS